MWFKKCDQCCYVTISSKLKYSFWKGEREKNHKTQEANEPRKSQEVPEI